MNEISSDRLSAGDLPDTDDQTEVAEFAHTFDGYRHFGEAYEEGLGAVRGRWKSDGSLPEDIDALRACLFLERRRERFVELDDVFTVWDRDGNVKHEADPERVTPARREQERFKRAHVDRIGVLLE